MTAYDPTLRGRVADVVAVAERLMAAHPRPTAADLRLLRDAIDEAGFDLELVAPFDGAWGSFRVLDPITDNDDPTIAAFIPGLDYDDAAPRRAPTLVWHVHVPFARVAQFA